LGSGFRVQGSGFRVAGSGAKDVRVRVLRFGVKGSGFAPGCVSRALISSQSTYGAQTIELLNLRLESNTKAHRSGQSLTLNVVYVPC